MNTHTNILAISLAILCSVTLWNVAAAEPGSEALTLIGQQEARIPALREKLDAAAKEGLPVFYPRSDLAIGERFCQYCRDDAANGRPDRALEVANEVKGLLDRAEREMRGGVDVPVLKPESPIEIKDGSFWATCRYGGKEESRPVFLTGYGHFGPVVEDLPFFPAIGINVIQVEFGPTQTVFEDGVRDDAVRNEILPILDRAQAHGARVCLLISPHYFPKWALNKWPELRVDHGVFLHNTIDAPQARNIYEQHLRALIPLIKDHPALHSICLSNEPVCMGSEKDPFRLPLWREYVKSQHPALDEVNRLYGTSYASFDEITHPHLGLDNVSAAAYDGIRFNQARFAEWHAWMAGVIHSMAPALPCHAKVMMLPEERKTVLWGTDPWDFARLSEINGNDCYFLPPTEGFPWISNWRPQNMYYDLQRSMKQTPIFNTENHIISDRMSGFVNADHIYAAIWQGAIHGQGASTTWAWQRTYDAKSDFEGLILHRAACTAAMSRCALDLMRLSKEVAALQNVQPQVAILYSHAATLWDSDYVNKRSDVYESLNFCGIPIAFVTDEQVAEGNLKQYRCLIVPGARTVAKRAQDAIRKYKKNGGYVIAYGKNNLRCDEYGRPTAKFKCSSTLKETKGVELRDALLKALARVGVQPRIVLYTADDKIAYGAEWRSVACEGKELVNAVNFTRDKMSVYLPEGQWTNRVTGIPLPREVVLEPDVPVLAEAQ